MNNEEITLQINDHKHEIGSLKYRVTELEEQSKVTQELVYSVRDLASNMKNMLDEQKTQGQRLSALEDVPSQKWNTLTSTILTALTSGIVGVILGAVISFLN